MTIAMPDSIRPLDLPPGYPAYLGYADGKWATEADLRKMFPAAQLVILTVTGATGEVHGVRLSGGIDDEPGNPDAAAAARWAAAALAADPGQRPVIYADLASRGYSMTEVLAGLAELGVARSRVRLLTAHYGEGMHICSPVTCKGRDADGNVITFAADGTQWTDAYPGAGGAAIDMSALNDGFFGAPAPVTVEVDVKLRQLAQGSTGQQVANAQALIVSHGLGYMIADPAGGNVALDAGVDGVFGPRTEAATRRLQAEVRVPVTGVWDAATWTAALG